MIKELLKIKRENIMKIERILVIGAGVNGSICAAYLCNHGIDVTVLGRGKRLDILKRDGIVIENPFSGKRITARVKVVDRLSPNDKYDYILIVVRNNQIRDLLPMLDTNVSPNLVFMGNNLAGPKEITRIIPKERVLMGFVFGGGKRNGDIISGIVSSSLKTPFGEIDGQITPRLTALVNLFNESGLKAKLSNNIVDFLSTHAVGVPVVGLLTMKYKNDVKALARSNYDMDLLARALKEAFKVLKATGHKITPFSKGIAAKLPTFLLKLTFKLLLASKMGEVGLAWHVSQAPDEMHKLAADLIEMVNSSKLDVPALQELLKLNTAV